MTVIYVPTITWCCLIRLRSRADSDYDKVVGLQWVFSALSFYSDFFDALLNGNTVR